MIDGVGWTTVLWGALGAVVAYLGYFMVLAVRMEFRSAPFLAVSVEKETVRRD